METALQLAGTTTMVRAGSNRPTVLIVEPSPAVRRAARLALFHAGYDCRESADADGALRFLHDQRPDLVVTGVAMDGPCDGIGLCAIIRSRSGLQHCPVVVLSGRSDPDGPPATGDAERMPTEDEPPATGDAERIPAEGL